MTYTEISLFVGFLWKPFLFTSIALLRLMSSNNLLPALLFCTAVVIPTAPSASDHAAPSSAKSAETVKMNLFFASAIEINWVFYMTHCPLNICVFYFYNVYFALKVLVFCWHCTQ